MRCHYLSDLHLETQEMATPLPSGDVLVIAGDLAHAACLDEGRRDPYAVKQRDRVKAFVDEALARFAHVLLVAGNHDHYDGVLEETAATLRRALPGVIVLDDDCVEIGGVVVFGSTLWSDFEGGTADSLARARKGAGEFFFVKRRAAANGDGGEAALERFRPEHALEAHRAAIAALKRAHAERGGKPMVVVTHHAPSLKGLNPLHVGNGLDGAYASDLDSLIASLDGVPAWVHGHTHIRKTYRVGDATVYANCRGFDGRDRFARGFKPDTFFEI